MSHLRTIRKARPTEVKIPEMNNLDVHNRE